MAITATYIAANQFKVDGSYVGFFPIGMKVKIIQWDNGTDYVYVTAATYNPAEGVTIVTVSPSVVTPYLANVERGLVSTLSTGVHHHTSVNDGGLVSASAFSSTEVADLQQIASLDAGNAHKVITVQSDSSGFEADYRLDWAGDWSTNTEYKIDDLVNNGYQLYVCVLSHISDASTEPGAGAYWASYWDLVHELSLKALSDVSDGVTDSGATQDLLVRGASTYDRFAKGANRDYLRINESGNLEWSSLKEEVEGVAGEALSQYDVVYTDSAVSGKWKKAQADGTTEEAHVWGIVTESGGIPDTQTGTIRLFGRVTNASWSWTPGAVLYLSNTAGAISQSAGTRIVQIGHAISATEIFFFSAGQAGADSPPDYWDVTLTAGEPLPQYGVVYLDPTGSGTAKLAINNSTAIKADAFGMAVEPGGIASGNTGKIAYWGEVQYASWAWTPGAWLYVGDTAGLLTETLPSTAGSYVKPFAQAVTATKIVIMPQTGWVIGAAGSAPSYPGPDYTPPSIKYKDADEIYIPAGRYHKGGYRFRGQYQDLANLGSYWTVNTAFAVDVDATYSAGTTSGMIQGAKVNSSWYSVFLMNDDEVLILPFIRVQTVDYNTTHAEKTTLCPAAHNDGTTAETGFFTANDAFNGYRLVKLDIEDVNDGWVGVIEDCIDGTPDEIILNGDQTTYIAAKDWFQMVPPAGVQCLYLGKIRIHSTGDLWQFKKTKWVTTWIPQMNSISGNLSTSSANTEMGSVISPVAERVTIEVSIRAANAAAIWVEANIYAGTSGNNIESIVRFDAETNNENAIQITDHLELEMTATSVIRNAFMMCIENPTAASSGEFIVIAEEE